MRPLIKCLSLVPYLFLLFCQNCIIFLLDTERSMQLRKKHFCNICRFVEYLSDFNNDENKNRLLSRSVHWTLYICTTAIVTFLFWASVKAFYTEHNLYIFFSKIITTEKKCWQQHKRRQNLHTAMAQTIKIGCRLYRMRVQTKRNALSKPPPEETGFFYCVRFRLLRCATVYVWSFSALCLFRCERIVIEKNSQNAITSQSACRTQTRQNMDWNMIRVQPGSSVVTHEQCAVRQTFTVCVKRIRGVLFCTISIQFVVNIVGVEWFDDCVRTIATHSKME